MAFWNGSPEPLRKNRWKIIFGHAKSGISDEAYLLKKCDKPSYKTLEITHKFGNFNYYYPGRVEWNPINMVFASEVGLDKKIYNLFTEGGISPPVGYQAALTALEKQKFSNALGPVTIVQLSGDGSTGLEHWKLINPFLTNMKFGELSYDSEEIIDLEITLRYDSAEYSQTAFK